MGEVFKNLIFLAQLPEVSVESLKEVLSQHFELGVEAQKQAWHYLGQQFFCYFVVDSLLVLVGELIIMLHTLFNDVFAL